MLIRINRCLLQLIAALLLSSVWLSAQEVQVSGQVLDAQSGKGLAGAEIRLPTLTFFSNDAGDIDFKANIGDLTEVIVTIFKPGFQEKQVVLNPKGRSGLNLGAVKLNILEGKDALSAEEFVPVVTLSESDLTTMANKTYLDC